MSNLNRWLGNFCALIWLKVGPSQQKTEEGQGLVEYALIMMMVIIVVVGILIFLGPPIAAMYSAVTKGIT